MYNVNGLAVFNPNKAVGSGRHFETWNQMPFIKRYCWAELANIECNVRLLFEMFQVTSTRIYFEFIFLYMELFLTVESL